MPHFFLDHCFAQHLWTMNFYHLKKRTFILLLFLLGVHSYYDTNPYRDMYRELEAFDYLLTFGEHMDSFKENVRVSEHTMRQKLRREKRALDQIDMLEAIDRIMVEKS